MTVRGTETAVLRWAALLAASGLVAAAAAPGPLVGLASASAVSASACPSIAPLALGTGGPGPPAPPPPPPARGAHPCRLARRDDRDYFGFFIGPPLMGFLSEAFGLRAAFGIGAAMILAIPLDPRATDARARPGLTHRGSGRPARTRLSGAGDQQGDDDVRAMATPFR